MNPISFPRLALLVFALSQRIFAEGPVVLPQRGWWPGYLRGPANAVDVSGQYAYLALFSGGMRIVDISDPANPRRVGGFEGSVIADVQVFGNYAYGSWYDKLYIIDVTNPTAPRKVSEYDGSVAGIAVSGNYTYILDTSVLRGLRVFDNTDPSHLTLVGSLNLGLSGSALAVSGNRAYIADSRLRVIDISNPTDPKLLGSGDELYATDIAISGSHVYVSDYNGFLRIIDVSDSANPRSVATVATPGRVETAGNFAYVANSQGLTVINISTPANPGAPNTFPFPANDIKVSGQQLFLTSVSGLTILDISNPSVPVPLGAHETAGSAYAVKLANGRAYLSDGDAGLRVIDVNDLANMRQLGKVGLEGTAFNADVAGGYAYVATVRAMDVVNVTDPANPQFVSRYKDGENVFDVALSGNRAFVAHAVDGMHIVDVSNPATPTKFLASFGVNPGVGGLGATAVTSSGDFIYVVYQGDGLFALDTRILDSWNSSIPLFTGPGYNTPGEGSGVAVSGNYAYVASWQAGLQIIDVANKESMQLVGSIRSDDWNVDGVAISGDYAILAVDRDGLVIVDVSDPRNPRVVANVSGIGAVLDVQVLGNLLYVASGAAGLRVFELSAGLKHEWIAGRLRLTWPTSLTEHRLQTASTPENNGSWTDLAPAPVQESGFWRIDTDPSDAQRYYRLIKL